MLAAIGIKLRFPENVTFVTWMVPVLVLGLPIFDTALVTLSRLRRGKNPLTTPGKDHVSHRLVAAGLSQREAVLTLYVVSFVLGLLAVFVTRASVVEGYIVGGAAALLGAWGLWRMDGRRSGRGPYTNRARIHEFTNHESAITNQQSPRLPLGLYHVGDFGDAGQHPAQLADVGDLQGEVESGQVLLPPHVHPRNVHPFFGQYVADVPQ